MSALSAHSAVKGLKVNENCLKISEKSGKSQGIF